MIKDFFRRRTVLFSSVLIFFLVIVSSLLFYLGNGGIGTLSNLANKSVSSFNTIADSVVIETNYGSMEATFLKKEAPLSVNSFLKLADASLYNGIKMFRLTKDFVQFSAPSSTPVVAWSEINKEPMTFGALGTVSASGGSYGGFFIVTNYAAPWLEGKSAVFARVTKGLEVLTAINNAPKNNKGSMVTPVVIKSIILK